MHILKTKNGLYFLLLGLFWTNFQFIHAQNLLPHADVKYQKARNILNKITNVNIHEKTKFGFEVEKKDMDKAMQGCKVALWNTTSKTLYLEEETLDVCATLGEKEEAALAFIIAHEFAHYLQGKSQGFTCIFNYKNERRQTSTSKIEMATDLLACTYVRLAGFTACDFHKELIDKIYQKFSFPENKSEYPSHSERVKIAQKSCAKSDTIVQPFLFANYLMAIGGENEYAMAADIYKDLAFSFTTREMYLNEAQAVMLQVLKTKNTHLANVFLLPLEWETKNNASVGEREETSTRALIQKLYYANTLLDSVLAKSSDHFNARLYQEYNTYLIGILNEKKVETAKYILQKWQKSRPGILENEKPLFSLLMGIMCADTGNTAQAIQEFDLAKSRFPQAVAYNLALLKGETPPSQKEDAPPIERVSNFLLADMTLQKPISLQFGETKVQFERKEGYILYEAKRNASEIKLARITSKELKTIKNMGIGTAKEPFLAQYSDFKVEISLKNGDYFYPYTKEKKAVFWLDSLNVKEWAVFSQK